MLVRVIIRLGEISTIAPEHRESLFSQDIAFLRELYNRISQLKSYGELYNPCCKLCLMFFDGSGGI